MSVPPQMAFCGVQTHRFRKQAGPQASCRKISVFCVCISDVYLPSVDFLCFALKPFLIFILVVHYAQFSVTLAQ